LSSILLSLCPFIVASSIFYQGYDFPPCYPPLHAHDCSSWRQPLFPTIPLYLLPYSMWRCCLFFPFLIPFWTLPLLVSPLSTLEASWLLLHNFLPPHLLYSTLHHMTFQYFKSIPSLCFLLQFQMRCLNFPHHPHNLSSLPSNSALSLVRACLSLSISLISWLY